MKPIASFIAYWRIYVVYDMDGQYDLFWTNQKDLNFSYSINLGPSRVTEIKRHSSNLTFWEAGQQVYSVNTDITGVPMFSTVVATQQFKDLALHCPFCNYLRANVYEACKCPTAKPLEPKVANPNPSTHRCSQCSTKLGPKDLEINPRTNKPWGCWKGCLGTLEPLDLGKNAVLEQVFEPSKEQFRFLDISSSLKQPYPPKELTEKMLDDLAYQIYNSRTVRDAFKRLYSIKK